MAKKPDPEKLYWHAKRKSALQDEYSAYLTEEKLERGPDSAHMFAIKARMQSAVAGMSERQIILALVDKLPYMYD